jgi:uncharacterized protein (TIGR03086 family)
MTENTQTDPRPLFLLAGGQAVALLKELSPAELDGPTPCTDYDVRTLAAHMISVLRRITHVAVGGNALDVPGVTDVADGEIGSTATAALAALEQAWADDDVLDRMLTLPFGTLPGRAAALAYTQELTVHAWDLATAVGRAEQLDPSPAEAITPVVQQFVPAQPRGGPVPFGQVVEVPESAGAYARLVGWLGRDPEWSR